MPTADPDSRRRGRRRLLAWAAAVALGVAAGAWVDRHLEQRRLREGERLAGDVAALVDEARRAAGEGRLEEAARRLEAASRRLAGAEGGRRGVPRAVVLVERAGLLVEGSGAGDGARAEAAALLEQAWGIDGVGPELRARIARDRAALAVLGEDLEAARVWYARAVELDPADRGSAERLEALGAPGARDE